MKFSTVLVRPVFQQTKQGVPYAYIANNGAHIIIFSRGIIAIETCKHDSVICSVPKKRAHIFEIRSGGFEIMKVVQRSENFGKNEVLNEALSRLDVCRVLTMSRWKLDEFKTDFMVENKFR